MSTQQLINAILMVSIFVLVFSGWSICVLLWVVQYARRRKRLQKRMGVIDAETQKAQTLQLWREEYQARRAAARRRRESLGERLERLRADAGWKVPAHVIFLSVGALAIVASFVPAMLGYRAWFGPAIGVVILVAFWSITKRNISQRLSLFERQLVESLGIAARALRAGHPLIGAFQSISTEIGEPVGRIFGEICQEQALGLDLQESIRRVANATHNGDLKLFATAVNIQMTTGGNLADVMDSLASVMRSRMRLNRRVRVLTASTRMNRNTLLAVPIILFTLLNIMSPQYMDVFYSTFPGRCMLGGTIAGMLFGAWVMTRLSIIRY